MYHNTIWKLLVVFLYILHEHYKCSCYVNKGQNEFKRRNTVWFFFSLAESIDNDLIIADYLYFIFDLLTNLVGRRIRPSISLCSWPGKYPWTLHPQLPDLWTLVLALSILILPYCYLDSASEKTDNNAQLKTWWLFLEKSETESIMMWNW